MASTLRNYIGGEWVASSASDFLELTNPATGEPLGRVPLSSARDVDQAVAAAQAAFLKWRQVPPVVRARYLFKLKALLEQHFDEIATIVTRENGKTLDEAKGSVRRGIENVEHACGIPTLMMGKTLEDVAAAIDCEYVPRLLAGRPARLPGRRQARQARAGAGWREESHRRDARRRSRPRRRHRQRVGVRLRRPALSRGERGRDRREGVRAGA